MRAKDALGIAGEQIDEIIEQAPADLARLGITGKDITP